MSRLTICLLCLPVFVPGSLSAGEKPLTSDLAFVPPNCAGFIHVRVQDIWKSEHAREWRDTVMKAGAEALKTLDLDFFPGLSSIERVTVLFTMPEQRYRYDPDAVLIVACSKPIDKDALLKKTFPGAKKEKDVYFAPARNIEIYFIDAHTFAMGSARNGFDFEPVEPAPPGDDDEKVKGAKPMKKTRPSLLARLAAGPRNAKSMLSDALALANNGKPIVAALNGDVIPSQVVRLLPPEYHALFKLKLAVGSVDFAKEGNIDVRLTYNSAGEAAAAELSAREGISLARSFLEKERAAMEREIFADGQPGILDDLPRSAACLLALGCINKADDYLLKLPIKKAGNNLTLSLKMPEGTRMFLASGAVSTAVGWLMFGRDYAISGSSDRPYDKKVEIQKEEAPKNKRGKEVIHPGEPARIGDGLTYKGEITEAVGSTIYKVNFEAGKTYVIDMVTPDVKKGLDPYLHLLDAEGKTLAQDDDGGGFPNARITFETKVSGVYQIRASGFGATMGSYTLTVREKK